MDTAPFKEWEGTLPGLDPPDIACKRRKAGSPDYDGQAGRQSSRVRRPRISRSWPEEGAREAERGVDGASTVAAAAIEDLKWGILEREIFEGEVGNGYRGGDRVNSVEGRWAMTTAVVALVCSETESPCLPE